MINSKENLFVLRRLFVVCERDRNYFINLFLSINIAFSHMLIIREPFKCLQTRSLLFSRMPAVNDARKVRLEGRKMLSRLFTSGCKNYIKQQFSALDPSSANQYLSSFLSRRIRAPFSLCEEPEPRILVAMTDNIVSLLRTSKPRIPRYEAYK